MKPDEQQATPAVRPELKADHTWYNSLFTQLLAPLFGFRYLFEAIEDINPKNFLGKDTPKPDLLDKQWRKPGLGRYASFNFISLGMGTLFAGIMARYSSNTLHDIKSVYAEAVGYELNKKPEDVTMDDIFNKSQNAALAVTREAYTWRTLARAATVATFFVPWHKFRSFKEVKPKYDANAKIGVGAIAAYIYGEGFLREPSFFDAEQKMVSSKINHKDVSSLVTIQPQDVQSLLNLQRSHENKNYIQPDGASTEAQNDIALSARIADLLNQNYNNSPRKEDTHFNLGKLNFLIGFHLLNEHPAARGFVELANRSKDMSEVKQAADSIRAGYDPQSVFAQFGIDLQSLVVKTEPTPEINDDAQAKFTKKLAPKTHQDYATHNHTQHIAV